MMHVFMGQCLAAAALLPIDSLNTPAVGWSPDNPVEIGEELADPTAMGETTANAGVLAAKARDFVQTLSPRAQNIVLRFYWDEERQEDIAASLGITQSAVAHTLRRVHQLGRSYFNLLEH